MLPHGHTLTDLSREAWTFLSIPEDLVASLQQLDGLEFLCPFAPVRRDEPTIEERDAFLATLTELSALARADLGGDT